MSRINVFITVDTEHSIGGAFRSSHLKPVGNQKRIFGSMGNKYFGIPLIMDIADAFNIRLTFFVEVLNKYYFGEEETKKVCAYIFNRGHDVQLHLHPNFLNFTLQDPREQTFSDLIGTYPFEKQLELIQQGKEILAQNGIPRPIAFRAGCFGANEVTLRALRATGFVVDSSYNRSYLGEACLLREHGINDLSFLEDIWELPVTNFIERSGIRSRRYIPLDINGASSYEMKYVLDRARLVGPHNITIVLHSFSFVKSYDVQYNKIKPRRHVICRFENLCRFLTQNSHLYAVRTLGSLNKEDLGKMVEESAHVFHRVPARLSLMRGWEQLKDNLF